MLVMTDKELTVPKPREYRIGNDLMSSCQKPSKRYHIEIPIADKHLSKVS